MKTNSFAGGSAPQGTSSIGFCAQMYTPDRPKCCSKNSGRSTNSRSPGQGYFSTLAQKSFSFIYFVLSALYLSRLTSCDTCFVGLWLSCWILVLVSFSWAIISLRLEQLSNHWARQVIGSLGLLRYTAENPQAITRRRSVLTRVSSSGLPFSPANINQIGIAHSVAHHQSAIDRPSPRKQTWSLLTFGLGSSLLQLNHLSQQKNLPISAARLMCAGMRTPSSSMARAALKSLQFLPTTLYSLPINSDSSLEMAGPSLESAHFPRSRLSTKPGTVRGSPLCTPVPLQVRANEYYEPQTSTPVWQNPSPMSLSCGLAWCKSYTLSLTYIILPMRTRLYFLGQHLPYQHQARTVGELALLLEKDQTIVQTLCGMLGVPSIDKDSIFLQHQGRILPDSTNLPSLELQQSVDLSVRLCYVTSREVEFQRVSIKIQGYQSISELLPANYKELGIRGYLKRPFFIKQFETKFKTVIAAEERDMLFNSQIIHKSTNLGDIKTVPVLIEYVKAMNRIIFVLGNQPQTKTFQFERFEHDQLKTLQAIAGQKLRDLVLGEGFRVYSIESQGEEDLSSKPLSAFKKKREYFKVKVLLEGG